MLGSELEDAAALDLLAKFKDELRAVQDAGLHQFNFELDEYETRDQIFVVLDIEVEDLEWFQNVPEGVIDIEDVNLGHDSGVDTDDEDTVQTRKKVKQTAARRAEALKPDPDGFLLPGLGTMMQEAVDWLSEESRQDYQVWKADILTKMGGSVASEA